MSIHPKTLTHGQYHLSAGQSMDLDEWRFTHLSMILAFKSCYKPFPTNLSMSSSTKVTVTHISSTSSRAKSIKNISPIPKTMDSWDRERSMGIIKEKQILELSHGEEEGE